MRPSVVPGTGWGAKQAGNTTCIFRRAADYYRMKTDTPPPTEPASLPILSGKEYYERSLTVALLRARETTMRRFKKYADAQDLTLPQWRVLRALADGEPLDAGTLCQRCVILPPSLTRILRAMAERGLLVTVPCSDARRHMVTLTPKGQKLFDQLVARSEGARHELDAAFGVERMQQLLDLLNDLRAIAETLPESDPALSMAPDTTPPIPRLKISRHG